MLVTKQCYSFFVHDNNLCYREHDFACCSFIVDSTMPLSCTILHLQEPHYTPYKYFERGSHNIITHRITSTHTHQQQPSSTLYPRNADQVIHIQQILKQRPQQNACMEQHRGRHRCQPLPRRKGHFIYCCGTLELRLRSRRDHSPSNTQDLWLQRLGSPFILFRSLTNSL